MNIPTCPKIQAFIHHPLLPIEGLQSFQPSWGLAEQNKKGVLFGVLILCLTTRDSMAPAGVVDSLLVGRHNLRAPDEVLARPGLPSASQDLVGLPEF